jgi:hypothetical protein
MLPRRRPVEPGLAAIRVEEDVPEEKYPYAHGFFLPLELATVI